MKAICDDCGLFSYAPKKDLAKAGWRFVKLTDKEGVERSYTVCHEHNYFSWLVMFLRHHLGGSRR